MPAENLGRYKSDRLEPRVLLPGTTTVLQQATSKFNRCSMLQQRVLDCWQLRQLVGGHDIPGRFLFLLETIPLSCRPELNGRGSGDSRRGPSNYVLFSGGNRYLGTGRLGQDPPKCRKQRGRRTSKCCATRCCQTVGAGTTRYRLLPVALCRFPQAFVGTNR